MIRDIKVKKKSWIPKLDTAYGLAPLLLKVACGLTNYPDHWGLSTSIMA